MRTHKLSQFLYAMFALAMISLAAAPAYGASKEIIQLQTQVSSCRNR
jgi:hypothetical protein